MSRIQQTTAVKIETVNDTDDGNYFLINIKITLFLVVCSEVTGTAVHEGIPFGCWSNEKSETSL